ncbi:MAG: type IV secretion system DNA-binding domain-containing protein [bacterium]
MENDDIIVFAETTFRNKIRKFGIKKDDRRRHMYLIGKTGMGKSTILENMIVEDIRAGHGVAVVDPHGDLSEKVIEYIPSDRIKDVVYFNPADMEYPIAFNVVEQVEPHLRHLVASGLIGVFQKLWADSWGPRLEYILRNSILAVLEYPGSTLLAITRMLSDKTFRKKVIEKIHDPVVKSFWVNEFAGYNDKFAAEAVSPIQNKVGQFLSSSLIRNIIGQTKSTIDMRKIMDEGKILILNLSKGRIGEDNSALLGAMVITKIQLAAMSRVNVPENERKDFYLYVDEFQNFATESFANILSEARKYRLNITLAHQYIEQLSEEVQSAVFGNVGTLIVFRVGAADAEVLMPEFAPIFTDEDIVNLPKYEIYLKLMIDGIASQPFSARGLRPLNEEEKTGNTEEAINTSRERYAKNKKEVEDIINLWHENGHDPENEQPPINKNKKIPVAEKKSFPQSSFGERTKKKEGNFSDNDIYKYSAICARCGKETKTSFLPDGLRPVLCKECLRQSKKEKQDETERRLKDKQEELKKLKEKEDSKKEVRSESFPQVALVKEFVATEEEISLSEALRRGPVNFSGKKRGTNFHHDSSQNKFKNSEKQGTEVAPKDGDETSF